MIIQSRDYDYWLDHADSHFNPAEFQSSRYFEGKYKRSYYNMLVEKPL